MQGLIECTAVRPPQLGVDDAERAKLRWLAGQAGLLGPKLRAAQAWAS